MNWEPPLKPAEIAEKRLIQAILENNFPVNSLLPPERELSTQIGVTRPTLREALQRLARDGWLEIHQGKPTRVRDYWKEGNLTVLSSMAKYDNNLSSDFVIHLLEIRLLLSPTYTKAAIENSSQLIFEFLNNAPTPLDHAGTFATFDWHLHQILTQESGNPIYALILNGFEELYKTKGLLYFSAEQSRNNSLKFYKDLQNSAKNKDFSQAFNITQETMQQSIKIMQSFL